MTEAESNDSTAAGPVAAAASIRRNPDVVSRRVGEEVVLVNLKTNRIFTLSRTGSRFWELLEAGEEPGAIEAKLLDEFEVGRAELSQEIERLLGQLREAGLVGADD